MGLLTTILSDIIKESTKEKKNDVSDFAKEEMEKGNYEPYEMEQDELDDDMPYYSSDDE